jgi:hypothetical protein
MVKKNGNVGVITKRDVLTSQLIYKYLNNSIGVDELS